MLFVATIAPMKRGLKDGDGIPGGSVLLVATIAPMKRGLKVYIVLEVVQGNVVATIAPDEKGTESCSTNYVRITSEQ